MSDPTPVTTRRDALKAQPVAGEGTGRGPLKVPAEQRTTMLGLTSVTLVRHPRTLRLNDTTLV